MQVSLAHRGVQVLTTEDVLSEAEAARDGTKVVAQHIRVVDLSYNLLSEVTGLVPFTSLTTLDVSHNKLESLRGIPMTVVRIFAAHNNLTQLSGIQSLPSLQELDVSHNLLRSLDGLSRNTKLRVLNCAGNRITSLDGLQSLPALSILDIGENKLSTLKEVRILSVLRGLKELRLEGNALATATAYRATVFNIIPTLVLLDATKGRDKARPTSASTSSSSASYANRPRIRLEQTRSQTSVVPPKKKVVEKRSVPIGYGRGRRNKEELLAEGEEAAEGAQATGSGRRGEVDTSGPLTMELLQSGGSSRRRTYGKDEEDRVKEKEDREESLSTSAVFDRVREMNELRRIELSEGVDELKLALARTQRLLDEERRKMETVTAANRNLEFKVTELEDKLEEEQRANDLRQSRAEEVESELQRMQRLSQREKRTVLQRVREEKEKRSKAEVEAAALKEENRTLRSQLENMEKTLEKTERRANAFKEDATSLRGLLRDLIDRNLLVDSEEVYVLLRPHRVLEGTSSSYVNSGSSHSKAKTKTVNGKNIAVFGHLAKPGANNASFSWETSLREQSGKKKEDKRTSSRPEKKKKLTRAAEKNAADMLEKLQSSNQELASRLKLLLQELEATEITTRGGTNEGKSGAFEEDILNEEYVQDLAKLESAIRRSRGETQQIADEDVNSESRNPHELELAEKVNELLTTLSGEGSGGGDENVLDQLTQLLSSAS